MVLLDHKEKRFNGFVKSSAETLNLEVKMWDERLTTVAANRVMLEGDLSDQNEKKL